MGLNNRNIRLLLLDDHILFREGLRRLLESETDFETVAECGTLVEGLEVLSRSAIDIVLLDFDLEDETGTRFISKATALGYRGKTLMVTAGMSPLDTAVARKLGISGIFLKHSSPATLLQAIRTVAAGRRYVDPQVINDLVQDLSLEQRGDSVPQPIVLSDREEEVMRFIAQGFANKEIAAKLCLHEGSVERHTTSLLRKAGCDSRSRLIARFWTAS